MKFCTQTLGCKVNQYETQAIEEILSSRGHSQREPGEGCDVCIINTCAVTAESARKSRQAVRRMKRLEPGSIIAVCGCLSQLDAQAIELLGADLIGGSGNRHEFALEIEARQGDGSSVLIDSRQMNRPLVLLDDPQHRSVFEELQPGGAATRTRALLKIQDGCDNFCSYCVIPNARGRSRSLPLDRVANHAQQLAEQGYREIVVTGIEISSYGGGLESAVRVISAAAPSARIRLGSLDPGIVTEEFCNSMRAIPNLCDHFHLSLQSGCDETLRRMGRMYEADTVVNAISSIRRLYPNCGITADLITGFPGETDAEFDVTLKMIKTAAFSGMHIFPFSPRPGTRAADMPVQISKAVRRERASIASVVAEEMTRDFKLNQIGKVLEVLFERQRAGEWVGYSSNYIDVAVKDVVEKNSIHPVRITGQGKGTVHMSYRP